jgi:hypothetical protein
MFILVGKDNPLVLDDDPATVVERTLRSFTPPLETTAIDNRSSERRSDSQGHACSFWIGFSSFERLRRTAAARALMHAAAAVCRRLLHHAQRSHCMWPGCLDNESNHQFKTRIGGAGASLTNNFGLCPSQRFDRIGAVLSWDLGRPVARVVGPEIRSWETACAQPWKSTTHLSRQPSRTMQFTNL